MLGFNWNECFKGDGQQLQNSLNSLCAVISRLPVGRRADSHFWIEYVTDRMPVDLAQELDRLLRQQPYDVQQSAASSFQSFARQLGKARNNLARRQALAVQSSPADRQLLAHPGSATSGDRRKLCSDCGLRYCPHGETPARACDVFGEPTFNRIKIMARYPDYQKKVEEKRAEAKRPALVRPETEKQSDGERPDPAKSTSIACNTHARELDELSKQLDEMFDQDSRESALP